MPTRLRQRWPVHLLTNVAVPLLLLGTCRLPHVPALTELVAQPSPQPEALPEFLVFVRPEPGKWQLTDASIGAVVRLDEIADTGEALEVEDVTPRTELLLDGQRIDIRADEWISHTVLISSGAERTVGDHQATIRVQKTSGEILEYSWSFSILAERPRMPGMPPGVLGVRPVPGSTISLHEYEAEELLSRD